VPALRTPGTARLVLDVRVVRVVGAAAVGAAGTGRGDGPGVTAGWLDDAPCVAEALVVVAIVEVVAVVEVLVVMSVPSSHAATPPCVEHAPW
jgi:hypothetical protein